jgi:conjugative transfer pilus assembly protein TraH
MNKNKILSLFCASIITFMPLNAQADMGADLVDFWQKSGGGVNISNPTFYEGQSAGFATLGSVQVRTRTRNTNLLNIQLPSVRAGCGGIDVFGGSFSFISEEELIKMMEAIMQNAAGFAFELALESLSPAVQEVVAKLRDLLQQVNAMNINSCEAGQVLASSIWPAMEGASQHICKAIGSYQGLFSDHISARHHCTTGGQQNQTLANAGAELKDQVPVDINYAWEAIKKNPFLNSNRDIAEFFMSLTGTIVTTAAASDSEGPQHITLSPMALTEAMVNVLVEGGSVQAYRCGSDYNKCLSPTKLNLDISINSSLKKMTSDTIRTLYEAIKEDSDVGASDEAIALLGMTSVPVLQMLITGMSYQHIFVENEIDAMAEIVAVDMAMLYITQAMDEMAKSASRLVTFGNITFQFTDQISKTQNAFSARRQLAAERYSQSMRTLERLALAKKELSGYSSSRFTTMLNQ